MSIHLHDRVTLKTSTIDERTGYLRGEAVFSRVGIQEYYGYELGLQDKRANDIVRVYRSPEEVAKSVPLLAGLPTTDDHPAEDVNASNIRRLGTGWTGDSVSFDQKETSGRITLVHSDAIQKWKNGKKELSVGYACDVVFDKGVSPEGEEYDARQIGIIPNHVAQVDAGRCGPACRIKDHQVTDCQAGSDKASCECNEDDDMSTGNAPTLVTRTVDGITFQVNDQAAQFIDKLVKDLSDHKGLLQTAQVALETARTDHVKAIEAKDGEIAGLKTQIPDAARLDALATERAAMIADVRQIMGSTYDVAGKTNIQMMTDCVAHRLGADNVKDKSPDFIQGVFATIKSTTDGNSNDPVRDVIMDGSRGPSGQQQRQNGEVRGRDAYLARLNSPQKKAS